VIQTGNGTGNQYDSNAKKVVQIKVEGGTQSTTDWSFQHSCKYNKTLDSAAINDSGQPGANNYGLRTYEINLADFTCTSGDLTSLKRDVKQVTVQLVGGIDPATDSTSGAYTFLQTGLIAFSKSL
jgi:hypothetical protein